MPGTTTKTIGVVDDGPLTSGHTRLFAMLERVFDVRFTATTQDEIRSFDAWLVLNYGRTHAAWASRLRVPCYMAIDTQPAASSSLDGIELVVANRSEVPSTIAGRTIRSAHAGTFEPLPGWLPQTTPLASIRGAPVWGIRGAPPSRNHFVGIPVPELGDGQPLFQCFDDGHLAEIIPLLSFLRELTDDPRWTEPPLSACFMFDDPNLHWPTYGHLDFAEVAGQAARHRYHVAFATIPLDGWFVHSKTAALFRDHPEALSLLIHGNDHVKEELARRMSDAARAAMLRQALHRIVNLEKRSGVYVSRIMAPPHGACSEETLAQMCMSGFEAACISKGSLRHYNPRAPWLATVGVGPVDVIRGVPVFPRFRMSRNCLNSILVAALLRQPIIPVGHHQDVAGGLDLLAELAQIVNSLGDVRWASMTGIARSRYQRRVDGNVLRVRMRTRHVTLSVPKMIDRIVVERPWLPESTGERLLVRSDGSTPVQISERVPCTVRPGQRLDIVSRPLRDPFAGPEPRTSPRPWPIVRRVLTEARDRAAPKLRRVPRHSSGD